VQTTFSSFPAIALVLAATWAAPFSTSAGFKLAGGLAATRSGSDLILSFPTTSTNYYGLQTRPDLLQQWADLQSGIQGNGTVKTITITNAISAGQGFYELLIQPTPSALLLPQSTAFDILGHSCGGIQEQVNVTGFDPFTGYPSGNVYLQTRCGGSGRDGGGHTTIYTASAKVIWDFAGNVVSVATPAAGPVGSPSFHAIDAYCDIIYDSGAVAYLLIPFPEAPTGVTAVQSGDNFLVSWTPNEVNPSAITSSTLTATPLNSTASMLTTIIAGPASNGVILSLQPQTQYQITVVNITISGPSPPSAPITVTTKAATVAPAAPTKVTANWSNLDPAGATDTLVATWLAADPGDSPIDQYQIMITGSDGSGTFTQTVSGTTLTTSFNLDYIPNWTVAVKAHNAVGWGALSAPVVLGGL
jgi:hypothetical protein